MKWNNLTEILVFRASETPNKTAYLHLQDFGTKEVKLSYQELFSQSQNIANYLQATTDEKDRIILMFDNSLDFITSYYGCLLSKRIAVPVHPPLTEESMSRLNLIIKDANPSAIFTNTDVQKNLKKLDLLRFFSRIPILSRLIKLPKIVAKRIPINMNSLEPICVDQLGTYHEGKQLNIHEDDIAFIQYSSGSTTTPKGVIVTHKNIICNQEISDQWLDTDMGTQGVGWLPISHDMGLIGNIIFPLYRGFTYIFFTPLEFVSNPIFWLKMITKYRSVASGGPNFAYELCAKKITEKEKENLDLSSWKIAYNGAEPIFESTLDNFANEFASCGFEKSAFMPCYGLAEATLIVTGVNVGRNKSISVSRRSLEKNQIVMADDLAHEDKKDLVSVGHVFEGTDVKIIDPATQHEVENYQIGEVVVNNGCITQGYWGVKDNSELFVTPTGNEKYLRTGDLGVFIDNNLYITGRIKDLIILNGKNFYPQDFESVSGKAHSLCRTGCTAAFSIQDDSHEEIVIVQEVKSKDSGKLQEIEQSIRQALSRTFQIIVKDVALVPEYSIPKTTSGKIQRYLTRKMYREGNLHILNKHKLQAQQTKEQNGLDPHINNMLKEVLRIEIPIDPKEHILALGVNSLLVAQLCMKINDEYRVNLQIKDILEAKNIEEIVNKIKAPKSATPQKQEFPIVPRDDTFKEYIPMSFAQKRMWFLDKRFKGEGIYNVLGALEVKDKLDGNALHKAVDKLIEDHEILRTVFVERKGSSYQKVLKNIEGYFEELDPTTPLQEIIDKEKNRIFNLDHGPLFKVIYIPNPANNTSHLIFNIHHIITDGWSIALLTDQLGKYYQEAINNRLHTLQAPKLQYGDYSLWQNQFQTSKHLLEQEKFWTAHHKDSSEPLKLPSDFNRINKNTHAGASVRFTIPENLRLKMKEFEKKGITPFMMLFGIYTLLLHRYTDEEIITTGVPVANRLNSATREMQGLFVNTLALKTRFNDGFSFANYINSIRKLVLDGLNNQEYPFENLVQKLKYDRLSTENPLFNTMFVFESYPEALNQFAGIESNAVRVDSNTAIFDLTMQVFDGPNIEALLNYRTDMFTIDSMERFTDNYLALLENAIREPDKSIRTISIMPKEAEGELLYSFNHTEYKPPINKSVVSIFEDQVEMNGSNPAVTFGAQTLTYSELNALANTLAKKIVSIGIKREEIIGVYLNRSIEMVVAILAIMKAGGAYLPLNPDLPKDRLDYMINDSKLRIILTTQKNRENILFEAVFLDCDTALLDKDEENLNLSINPHDLMYVIYTSGSTGKPKGVLIENKGIVRLACMSNYFDFKKVKKYSQLSNFSFDASAYEIWCTLLNGGNIVIIDIDTLLNPDSLHSAIIEQNIDTMFLTTTLFHKLYMENPHVFDGLKNLFVGGEALNPQIVSLMLENNTFEHFFNVYGPTENSVLTTTYEIPLNTKKIDTMPIGKPDANITTYILDKYLNPVPIGVYGVLYIGGDSVGRGYLNGTESQNKKFISNPFGKKHGERLYNSGDICRYLADGNIEYMRRLDNQVKINGYRIELQEIESVIREEPNVKHAAVIVREDTPHIKHIVAYVVFGDKTTNANSFSKISEAIKQKLPAFMSPQFYIELEQLPLNSNGKLDTKRLPQPELKQDLNPEIFEFSDTEKELAQIFSQVLNIDEKRITPRDHFFDLGGDSILSMQIAYRMRKKSFDMTVKDIFEYPQIKELAAYLDTKEKLLEKQQIGDETVINENELFPVSSMQDFILSYRKKHPGSPSFHPQLGFEVTDKAFDMEKLITSFNTALKNHPSLRTQFINEENTWFQKISGPAPEVHVLNYESYGKLEQENLLQQLFVNEQKIDFDLKEGPLFRVNLIKLSVDHCYLFMSCHHAISDGKSLSDLLKEVYSNYRNIPLPEVNFQDSPKDFVDFEKNAAENPLSKAFWKQRCDEALHNKPSIKNSNRTRFNTALFYIHTDMLSRLHKISSELHLPLKSILLSAYFDALAQFYHQSSITVSVVTPTRTEKLPQSMDAHGLYWKLLPLHFNVHDNKNEQLHDLQKQSNDLLEHVFYPLNAIYTAEQLDSIFYASFNFTNFIDYNDNLMKLLGITLNSMDTSDTFSSPIQLKISLEGSEAKVNLTMDKEIFSEQDVINFTDLFKHALFSYLYSSAKTR